MKNFLLLVILPGIISCNNNDPKPAVPDNNNPSPESMSYSVIHSFPHDTSSFTQGLVIYNGQLYEGTGLNNQSELLKVDLKTGTAEKKIRLDSVYFGEGITILHDTIYQLTWQNHVVFAYTLKDFKKVKEFKINTEGWGITNDGKRLIVSDGSSNLFFYDPSTFDLLLTLPVTEAGSSAYNLNELEYINGYIYANEWQLPYIIKIDPQTGFVVAKTDLSDLWQKVNNKNSTAVPNGIAYDEATKKIYITGKLWPNLFEVQFSK
jgi:glutaminyl-peptide cyclotransferase